MTYEFFAHADKGRVRANNEDAVAFDEASKVAVLADGMGGYNAGEIASSMATTFIRSEMASWLAQADDNTGTADVRQALESSVDSANQAIYGASLSNPQYTGMGTTLVVAVFYGARLILGHVGDSRCYRWRQGVLQQLTRDHSWLQEQVDAGLLTPQQAALAPNRNLVTRALGVEATVQMEVNEFDVMPGDLFLMCSDGLTDMISETMIADILRAPANVPAKGMQLIELANARGGRDNVSVLIALAPATDLPSLAKKRSLLSRLLGGSA